jgi:hypothetical protein
MKVEAFITVICKAKYTKKDVDHKKKAVISNKGNSNCKN